MDTPYKQKIGASGEDRAVEFLQERGFSILERNFRFQRAGEIDIIAQQENLLIFVEVKSRKSDHFGGARYAINNKKKRSFRLVAEQFLLANKDLYRKDVLCRFDMIALENDSIEWIEDIIR